MAKAIYKLETSIEEDRPFNANIRGDNPYADRELMYFHSRIFRGQPGADVNRWSPPDLECSEPGTGSPTEWDYYSGLGSSGLFSQRAVDVLGDSLSRCFALLPATFEGEPYYLLHIRERIDCLNASDSEITFVPTSNWTDASSYSFAKGRVPDPLIFVVNDDRLPVTLFVTESIPVIVQSAGLKGFDFQLVDGTA